MKPLPLVGLTEIAMRAGVQKQAVAMWRARHEEFPAPVAELRTGAVFWWPEVEKWLLANGRRADQNWTLAQINAQKRGPKTIAAPAAKDLDVI